MALLYKKNMDNLKSIEYDKSLSSNKTSKRYGISLIFLIMVLLIRTIIYFAAIRPDLVEKIYSFTIYPIIGNILGKITSTFPFSLGELIIISLPLGGILIISYLIIGQELFKEKLSKIVHLLIRTLSLIYILFYLLWGFNYYREDYGNLAGWENYEASFEDLTDLTHEIILEMNILRLGLDEDEAGIFRVEDDFKDLNHIALAGFKDYSVGSFRLDNMVARSKPVLLSNYMSYTGITGVYFPFTGEANVNIAVPHITMLSTITHEIAHHKGFAKEDEANFIAYKANTNNPDKRFQYSGYYLAMTHLLNEVYSYDIDEYARLFNILSDEIKSDIENSRDYWKIRRGQTEKMMTKVNDSYLKSNNQEEGVKSYNGVVKLLLDEYLNAKGIDK